MTRKIKTYRKEITMPQIDITTPKNVLNAETKGQLLTRLTQALNKWEGVPPTSPTVQWAWAFFHEVAEGEWAYGGKVATSEDKPRYRILITVPESVMDMEHKKGLIEEITQVIGELDATKSGPTLLTCLILEVPDGGYGVAGQVYIRPR